MIMHHDQQTLVITDGDKKSGPPAEKTSIPKVSHPASTAGATSPTASSSSSEPMPQVWNRLLTFKIRSRPARLPTFSQVTTHPLLGRNDIRQLNG